jgi:DNA-binding NtrC family response regulator
MAPKSSILVIDDEEIIRDIMARLLEDEGYEVTTAASGEEGIEAAQERPFDLVMLDLMLPGKDGLAILKKFTQESPDTVIVMVTAYASIEDAVAATKSGAFDFLTKPFKNDELMLVIKNGLEKQRLLSENLHLRKTLHAQSDFQNIIGKSEVMQQIFGLVTQVGPQRSTVLITGESGTGKELIAKAIHNCSPRADGSFMAVNSGTIPFDLLESELFGHVKGAFTGATSEKKGLFEVADQGTIFLDEIGNIPIETQAKLLRVIQEREFRKVGGIDTVKVDVRIIAATHSDLKMLVEQKGFREDLFYRLNVINLVIPPLRERKEDIPLLVDHFMSRFSLEAGSSQCSMEKEALRVLMEYDWPGNVRELENVIERATVLVAPDRVIREDLFPKEVLEGRSVHVESLEIEGTDVTLKEAVQDFEKEIIVRALQTTRWHQKKAAVLLGVNPTTLNEKIKRMKIEIPSGDQ